MIGRPPGGVVIMLVLRNVECRHVLAAANDRDKLVDMQAALVAAGRTDYRIETVGSEAEAADHAADLVQGISCPTCHDPLCRHQP